MMPYVHTPARRGARCAAMLGDITPQQEVGAGITAAGSAAAVAASGAITDISAGLLVTGPVGAAVAAALAGAYALYTLLRGVFSGCGSTCVIATQAADKVEVVLKQNRDQYLAGPRIPDTQKAALANFDYAWAALVQACSDPQLGDAGRRCISERQRGGSAPWCPTTTGCDWFILYRDPIANDPAIHTLSSSLLNLLPSPLTVGRGNVLVPLLGAALIGVAVLAGGD